MKTITKNKNRIIPEGNHTDSENSSNMQSLLWHLKLQNRISNKDSTLLETITPEHCSLFVLFDDNLIFTSELFDKSFTSLKTEINFSCEATYAQQIYNKENGLLRVLTIPFDKQILVGLISPIGLELLQEIEDTFLHNLHIAQRKFTEILNSVDEMKDTIKHRDPLLIINRFDNQILTCNKPALSFFNLSQKKLLDSSLQDIQKNYPKASNRKINIKNCTIGITECSIVQFSYRTSDSLNTDTIAIQLQSHAEQLLKLYRELQIEQNLSPELIKTKIAEVNSCYENLTQLHNHEKK